MAEHCAVIFAGGTGTRLWPMSRKTAPKQFQRIIGDQSTLERVYHHLRRTIQQDHIFIQVSKPLVPLVKHALPGISPDQILIEPAAKDTGPAIAFAIAAMLHTFNDPIVGIFYADHLIQGDEAFDQAIGTAYQVAEKHQDAICAIGVTPGYAHTGLGYIEMNHEHVDVAAGRAFAVDHFIEKPSQERANELVSSWKYLWNTGTRVMHAKSFEQIMAAVNPSFGKQTKDLITGYPHANFDAFEKQAIEFVWGEQPPKMFVVPSDMRWSDIGDWATVQEKSAEGKADGLVTSGEGIHLDSTNTLVYTKKFCATVGLKDMIVVETDDALLIIRKSEAQRLKEIITIIDEQGKQNLL